ncbi:MAG: hypothetical protein K0Q73_4406 [Paenibacillus sp.]|jgi:hypothetical protein|nr:hypothetical protein [Paenibacillus sp.]
MDKGSFIFVYERSNHNGKSKAELHIRYLSVSELDLGWDNDLT